MIKNSWFSKYFNVDERGEHQGLFDSSGGDCDLKKMNVEKVVYVTELNYD